MIVRIPVGKVVRSTRDFVPTGACLGVAGISLLVVLALNGSYYGLIFEIGLGYAIVTAGMVIQIGHSHQLAFSQSAFLGLGAYGVAVMETRYGFSPGEAVLAAVGLGAGAAMLMGSLVTRVPGLALALATLVLPLMLSELVSFSSYLNSYNGINGVLPLWSGGSYQGSLVQTGIVASLLLGVVIGASYRLLRSAVGLELSALAANEGMALGVGVGLRRRKMEVFVIGSALATLGGAVVASVQGVSSPDMFAETAELTLLIMLFIGGRRNLIAASLGAIGIEFLPAVSYWISTNLPIIEGVLLIGVFLFEPRGLAGLVGRGWGWVGQAASGSWSLSRKVVRERGIAERPEPGSSIGSLVESSESESP